MNHEQASFTPPLEINDPAEIAEICRFRAQVWRGTGQLAADAFSAEGWRDPIDSTCRHWAIRGRDGAIAAAGRLSVHATLDEVHQAEEYRRYGLDCDGPVAAPDRVVVAKAVQGYGLGWQILDVQDEAARQMGALHAVRQASPGMVRLITRRGWQILGPASPDARFPGVTFQVAVKSFAGDMSSGCRTLSCSNSSRPTIHSRLGGNRVRGSAAATRTLEKHRESLDH